MLIKINYRQQRSEPNLSSKRAGIFIVEGI